eukprot:2064798-Amphidinium_carterae.1
MISNFASLAGRPMWRHDLWNLFANVSASDVVKTLKLTKPSHPKSTRTKDQCLHAESSLLLAVLWLDVSLLVFKTVYFSRLGKNFGIVVELATVAMEAVCKIHRVHTSFVRTCWCVCVTEACWTIAAHMPLGPHLAAL